MNRKPTLLLLAVLVLVGLAGAWTLKRDAASWRGSGAAVGGKVLGEFDLNAVAQIVVTSGEGTVHLVRKNDTWTVQERANYPASFDQVAELIRKMWQVKVTENVPAGPAQFGRLQVEEPAAGKKDTGTLLDLLDANGQRITALLLGKSYLKKSPDMPAEAPGVPMGRYVRAMGGAGTVALVNEPFLNVGATPQNWLDHRFYQATAPQSLMAQLPTDSWTITREKDGADWQLSGAKADEKLDAGKATAAATAPQTPMFADVRAGSETKGLDPRSVLTLKTFDHFTYQLTVGTPEGDNVPVKVTVSGDWPPTRQAGPDEKPEDKTKLDGDYANQTKQWHDKLTTEKKLENWVYLLPKNQLDPALIKRADLLAPQPTPTPAAATPPVPAPAAK